MKKRVILSVGLIALMLLSGAGIAGALTSPLVSWEVCEGWTEMPDPNFADCEYFDDCLCYMRPVDEPPVSPLATPVSIDHDRPEAAKQKHTTTPEQSQALACLVASRWYGMNFNCEVY